MDSEDEELQQVLEESLHSCSEKLVLCNYC